MNAHSAHEHHAAGKVPLALILEGVSTRWQMNILQLLGEPSAVQVAVYGHDDVHPVAYRISLDQARHLATQLTELLGAGESCAFEPKVAHGCGS
jgi:hypothetical protein